MTMSETGRYLAMSLKTLQLQLPLDGLLKLKAVCFDPFSLPPPPPLPTLHSSHRQAVSSYMQTLSVEQFAAQLTALVDEYQVFLPALSSLQSLSLDRCPAALHHSEIRPLLAVFHTGHSPCFLSQSHPLPGLGAGEAAGGNQRVHQQISQRAASSLHVSYERGAGRC